MKKLLQAFWTEPAVAGHVLKGAATAIVAAIALWPLSTADVVVIATALGLAIPAAAATRAVVSPTKARKDRRRNDAEKIARPPQV